MRMVPLRSVRRRPSGDVSTRSRYCSSFDCTSPSPRSAALPPVAATLGVRTTYTIRVLRKCKANGSHRRTLLCPHAGPRGARWRAGKPIAVVGIASVIVQVSGTTILQASAPQDMSGSSLYRLRGVPRRRYPGGRTGGRTAHPPGHRKNKVSQCRFREHPSHRFNTSWYYVVVVRSNTASMRSEAGDE